MSLDGNWKMYYTWQEEQGASYLTAKITFSCDNSFRTTQGDEGRWALRDGTITLVFDNGTTCSGNMCGTAMVGTIRYFDRTARWYAVKQFETILAIPFEDSLKCNGEPLELE